jgi:hypothetical protein
LPIETKEAVMLRSLILSLALVSGPALAASYRAEPNAPAAQDRFVARDNIWRCGASECTSVNPSSTRPAIVCAGLSRRLGGLRAFSVDGRAFSAEELEACNRR